MIHTRIAVRRSIALAAGAAVTPVAAAGSTRGQARTLFFDAIFTHGRMAGSRDTHLGQRQMAMGMLRDARGRQVGSFRFTCTWTSVGPAGARERCTGSAVTSDGRLDAAGPSRSNAVTHRWRLTGGTGRYRCASGTLIVRDLGDREALLSTVVTNRRRLALGAGVVRRPTVNDQFIARADDLCAPAASELAQLPPFPFTAFDPLRPDPSVLPAVGAFFTGPGDPRPIARALNTQLRELGQPARERRAWRLAMRDRDRELAIMDEQDRAALARDVPGFIRSVHDNAGNFRQIAITETVFGTDRCVL